MDSFICIAQVGLSALFILGYFLVLVLSGMKYISVDANSFAGLTTFVGLILYYWFQRQRPHSASDPATVGVTPIVPIQPPQAAK